MEKSGARGKKKGVTKMEREARDDVRYIDSYFLSALQMDV